VTDLVVVLPKECWTAIDKHAERAFPEECCGFMLGRDLDDGSREIVELFAVDNQKDENRERRYLIEPKHQLAAEKHARTRGLDVVGVYHSHPNHPSRPSDFDRDHAMPFWSYVIVSCMQGKSVKTQSWRLREDRSQFDEESLR
jgi:proteasome lid subunit RPN8/RPN11